jgi:hypothetical protein
LRPSNQTITAMDLYSRVQGATVEPILLRSYIASDDDLPARFFCGAANSLA